MGQKTGRSSIEHSHISHKTPVPQCTTLEQKCVHFCSKVVCCGIWDRCIVEYVRLVYICLNNLISCRLYFDGLVQERRNSIAIALELQLSWVGQKTGRSSIEHSHISHKTPVPQCTTLEQKCVHFCSKVVCCGIWDRCIVEYVRLVYICLNNLISCRLYFDGLVQERRNSIAIALELQLSCTNPLICFSESMLLSDKQNLLCYPTKQTATFLISYDNPT